MDIFQSGLDMGIGGRIEVGRKPVYNIYGLQYYILIVDFLFVQ